MHTESDKMTTETEDFLSRCVVDTLRRTFYLYSEQGNEKVVECETPEQFMNVLNLVREKLNDDVLVYSNPL